MEGLISSAVILAMAKALEAAPTTTESSEPILDNDSYIFGLIESQDELNIILFVVVCAIGILLCLYAFHVEFQLGRKPTFVAACDINDRMSCTKVLSSRYAKGFGLVNENSIFNISNAIYGLLFYSFILIAAVFSGIWHWISFIILLEALIAVAGSIYLAYILFFVLTDICVVCISTYLVNALLFVLSVWRIVLLY